MLTNWLINSMNFRVLWELGGCGILRTNRI